AGDPRNQTEDLGDDPVKAGRYSTMNYKRMIPNLVAWTTRPGDDFTEFREVYEESIGRWFGNMQHITTVVGGVEVDLRSAEQTGAVYRVIPRARQKEALAFLAEQVFATPSWLAPPEITSRIGPTNLIAQRQAGIVTTLLSAARLGRMAEAEGYDATAAYPLAEYMADVRRALFTTRTPDAGRRQLQRVYVQRLEALIAPPAAAPGAAGGGGAPPRYTPFVTAPTVPLSDLPALARNELRAVQRDATAYAASTTGTAQAHWRDVVERARAVLEPRN
ncbi:MAG: zinc-dependent metalloprotease, partial [Gemmatimonadaceae bacterium]|nr:zinc-dependent metalloprotease [Gemmatimonadaceae bacterium]